jgi:ATP-binding cassette subfamily B protein
MKLPIARYATLLATYLKPQWHRTLLMTLALLSSIGLQLLGPQILRYFIDTALAGGASPELVIAGLLFIGVTLANQGISVAVTYLSESVAWTATNHMRSDLVAHCLSLDMAFHKVHTAGELIERIDGDVDALSNFFSQFFVNLLSSMILLIGILALFFTIHWLVGIAMTAFAALALLILMYIRRIAIPYWVATRQVSADFSSFLEEQFAGTQDIRANGATGAIMRRFYLLLRRWFAIYRKAAYLDYLIGSGVPLLFILGSALGFSLGAYLWSTGAISVGTVYLIYSYTSRLSEPVQLIQEQLQDLQKAEASIRRIDDLLQTRSAVDHGQDMSLPDGALAVDFRNVTFGYIEDEPVLHDMTFQVQPGHILGILGRTGSGKTTLSRLLFRLYDPQAGEIRVGDIPTRAADRRELRRHIGMVTQDVQIFHASVRDNLTFFNRSIPDARIIAALDDVGLCDWYRTLPDGLDSILGASGSGLSAGEAQLLAFARVFLTNPGLIILDEASSRLDPATEQRIEQAINRLLSGRTGMVIAHRLATIRRADEVMVIEGGRILEYGSREALAADATSHFAHLLQTGMEEILA